MYENNRKETREKPRVGNPLMKTTRTFNDEAWVKMIMQWIIHYPYVPLLMLWSSCSGEHQLLCSPETLQVMTGEDVILPCQVFPPVDMNYKKLEWTRISQPDPEYVLVRPQTRGQYDYDYDADGIHERYRHSTSLFTKELVRGNVSVTLSNVEVRDEGTFRCHAPETTQQSCFVTLSVVKTATPYITVSSTADGGLSLLCESGCWHPQPDVAWLDGEGNLLAGAQRTTTTGSDSSRHCRYVYSVLTPRHADNLTCRVSLLPRSNHTREAYCTYSLGLGAGQTVDPRRPKMDEGDQGFGVGQTVDPHRPKMDDPALQDHQGEPQLLCGPQKLQVMAGEDRLVLPCQVYPPVDMTNKKLEWTRTLETTSEGRTAPAAATKKRNSTDQHVGVDPVYIMLRPLPPEERYHADDRVEESYRHRASVFEDELIRGNVSIVLSSVAVGDTGTFHCHAPGTVQRSCSVTITVVEASEPYISVSGVTLAGGLALMCESGCWHPRPETTWLDGEGNAVPGQHVATVTNDGDYDEHRGFSRCHYGHAVVAVSRAADLTCRVSLPRQNVTLETRGTYSPGLGAGQTVDPRRPSMDEPELQDHQGFEKVNGATQTGCGLTRAVIICTGVLTASILLAVFYFCRRGNHQRKQWPWLCEVELPGESLLGVSSTRGLDNTEIPLAECSSGPTEMADTKASAAQPDEQADEQPSAALCPEPPPVSASAEQTLALQRMASSMESMQSTWTHLSAAIVAVVDSFTAKNT